MKIKIIFIFLLFILMCSACFASELDSYMEKYSDFQDKATHLMVFLAVLFVILFGGMIFLRFFMMFRKYSDAALGTGIMMDKYYSRHPMEDSPWAQQYKPKSHYGELYSDGMKPYNPRGEK